MSANPGGKETLGVGRVSQDLIALPKTLTPREFRPNVARVLALHIVVIAVAIVSGIRIDSRC